MIKAKYLCRNRDFESTKVRTVADNEIVTRLVEEHLAANPTHIVELVFVWEAV